MTIMAKSDQIKFAKYIYYGAVIYALYRIWTYPFEDMIIYDMLFEPIRLKLYSSLGVMIVSMFGYQFLSVAYENQLLREIRRYNESLRKKKNKYSNLGAPKEDKSWGDVIEEAKSKKRDEF